jgi:hypothetical protein
VIITSIVEVQNARRLLAVGVQVNYDIQWSSEREEDAALMLNDAIATSSFDKTLKSVTGTTVTATATPDVVNIDPTSMPTLMPVSTQTNGGVRLGTSAIIVIVVVVGGFL